MERRRGGNVIVAAATSSPHLAVIVGFGLVMWRPAIVFLQRPLMY